MTENENKFTVGILAFGSLIDEPGNEISEIEIARIPCKTPFNVEFARTSSTRGNAPTLIPVENISHPVDAVIIVLSNNTDIENAKSILYRREVRENDRLKTYIHSESPGINTVIIKVCNNFMGVATVLYTSIRCNIQQPLTGELLAYYSIKSILSRAGQEEKDGLRYLLAAKRNGIRTGLSDEYERQILLQTDSESLEEAIEILDRRRMMYPQI
jgi:hypothetical protein